MLGNSIGLNGNCQAPNIASQITLGGSNDESGFNIEKTSDGGYIVVGTSYSTDGNLCSYSGNTFYQATVIKFDSVNNIEWKNCYGGANYEEFRDIKQTGDGGYIAVGRTESNDGDVSNGGYHGGGGDIWLVKLSSSGNIEWQHCYGGSSYDSGYGVTIDKKGNFIVTGYTTSNDGDVSGYHGGGDGWVAKVKTNDKVSWQKCLGGSGNDQANSVIVESTGDIAIVGFTESNDGDISGNHGLKDVMLCTLDKDGILLLSKCIGGSQDDMADYLISDGVSFFVSGNAVSNDGDFSEVTNHGQSDALFMKLDLNFNIIWVSLAGAATAGENFSSISIVYDGFICAGFCGQSGGNVQGCNYGDYWVCAFNSNGKLNWQRCLGGTGGEVNSAAIIKNDNSIVVAGTTDSNDGDVEFSYGNESDGFEDIWIVTLTTELYPQVYNNFTFQSQPQDKYLCPGEPFNVPYKISGDFNTDNIFTLQLSEGLSDFSGPINIGSVASNVAGTIIGTPPLDLNQSTYYQMRIVASDPAAISNITPRHLHFACRPPANQQTKNITDQSATLMWNSTNCAAQYEVRYKIVSGGPYTYITTSDTFLNLSNLMVSTQYKWNAHTLCVNTGSSDWRDKDIKFKTKQQRVIESALIGNVALNILSNPSSNNTTISYTLTNSSPAELDLINMTGSTTPLFNQFTPAGAYTYFLSTNNLSAGLYFVKLSTADGVQVKKLVIQ